MKLISMVDYILQIDEIEPKAVNFSSITDIRNYQLNSYSKIVKYAEFLKQPLELWMFVPCDENGNVLEEPDYVSADDLNKDAIDKVEEYHIAKERILFEGFYFHELQWITNKDGLDIAYPLGNNKFSFEYADVEDLAEFNLTLTPNTIKQIFEYGK